MAEYWATCPQCPFETNSPKQASKHEHEMEGVWSDEDDSAV